MSTADLVIWGFIAGMAIFTFGRMIGGQATPVPELREPAAVSDQSTVIQRGGKTSMLERR